jgi:anaerobic selenocysteine-containing dehydrogenase
MEKIPMVVALAPFRDETAAGAHFILPTHVFLESWQESTTPPSAALSVLGLGNPVVEPFFSTRHPGATLLGLARRIGHSVGDALPWRSYTDYLKQRLEGLMVSGQGTVVSGSFEESWVHYLEERGWRFLEHSGLEQFWQDLAREAGWWDPVRSRGDWGRLFRTSSGRFEFFSRTLEQRLCEVGATAAGISTGDEAALGEGIAALALAAEGDEACLPHHEPPNQVGEGDLALVPFRPITARGRLGAVSPMLLEMFGHSVRSRWETWVELAPHTAHDLDLEDGDRVAVESDRAAFEAVVRVQPGAVPGVAHVPLGLGHRQLNSTARGVGSNPLDVLLAGRDSLSGALDLTSTRVRLRLVSRRPHGGPPPHGGHA